jgi:Zn-dependent M28 family amino/carboxypeptidase
MQQIYNIVAHFSTPAIENRPRLLLAAHYDTRPWCDEEENYADRFYNVPGANDGASGVGVLLEVGRQIGMRIADSTLYTPVDIVLFDCEDMGTPQFYIGQEREDTWCLGSQLWSTNYAQQAQPAKYKYGILLDMVGAPDAVFPKEMYSTQYAQNYQEQIWRSAEQLGYGALFSQQQSYPITDDHYYVNVIAGIPCVDIIHYDSRNATGFASWWHTRQDDMHNISKSTLQAVGEVVMSQVK